METYDDLIPDPTPDGEVDMSNLGWKVLDPVVWQYGSRVLKLTLAFNKIQVIPDEIATLHLLRDLDLEDNLLEEIPAALCKCRRLRTLKAPNNHIRKLPENLGECHMLEELLLSNNRLTSMPESVAKCDMLTQIDLRYNLLESLPTTYGSIETLRRLRLDGNNKLSSMVPDYLVDNNEQCLFLLQVFHRQREELRLVHEQNRQLERAAMIREEFNLRIKDDLLEAEEEFQLALKNFPHRFKRFQQTVKRFCGTCVSETCVIS